MKDVGGGSHERNQSYDGRSGTDKALFFCKITNASKTAVSLYIPVLETILFRDFIFPKMIYNHYRANYHNNTCNRKSYVLYILWI